MTNKIDKNILVGMFSALMQMQAMTMAFSQNQISKAKKLMEEFEPFMADLNNKMTKWLEEEQSNDKQD